MNRFRNIWIWLCEETYATRFEAAWFVAVGWYAALGKWWYVAGLFGGMYLIALISAARRDNWGRRPRR